MSEVSFWGKNGEEKSIKSSSVTRIKYEYDENKKLKKTHMYDETGNQVYEG